MEGRLIATSRTGAPLLFQALGAAFHLESLQPADAEGLARAGDAILGAIGADLRWTWSSVHPAVQPFSPSDLQLVSSFPLQLVLVDRERHDEQRAQRGASHMAAARYDRFGVACHGAVERNDASASTFRFYARVFPGQDGRFSTQAMIAFTCGSLSINAFASLVDSVAASLRVRWGNAGLTYGGWELDRYGETRDAIYAHSRRFPGFDVGQHATLMEVWHHRVRTVGWLTFLGAPLAVGLHDPKGDALVDVEAFGGGGVRLRAGEKPESGDANRSDFPRAYARADEIARPVRASGGVHFFAPWSEATTAAWLRRLEARG